MKKKKFYQDVSLMRNAGKYLDWFPLPVPVNMRCAESKAVVDEGGVYHDPWLCPLQEVIQVTQVSMTASDSVPRTIFVQHKHLARTEPALKINVRKKCRAFSIDYCINPNKHCFNTSCPVYSSRSNQLELTN